MESYCVFIQSIKCFSWVSCKNGHMLFHYSLSEHCCDDGLNEAVNSQNMIPVCLLNMSILQCQHGCVWAGSPVSPFLTSFNCRTHTHPHTRSHTCPCTLTLPLTVAWLSDINVYFNRITPTNDYICRQGYCNAVATSLFCPVNVIWSRCDFMNAL